MNGNCNKKPVNISGAQHSYLGSITPCAHNRLRFAYPTDPTSRNALTRDDVTRIEFIASKMDGSGPARRIKINSEDHPTNFEVYKRFEFAIKWEAGETAGLEPGSYRGEIYMTSALTTQFLAGYGHLDVKAPAAQNLAHPKADFEVDNNFLTLTFDASPTKVLHGTGNNQDLEIDEYRWDFGDGLIESSTTPSIQHTYDDEGEYYVELLVTLRKDSPSDPCEPLLYGKKTKKVCVELPYQ